MQFKIKIRLLVVGLVALVAAGVVTGVVIRGGAPDPADHPFAVDIGSATNRAASVAVGGRTFDFAAGQAGARTTLVALTANAGGVAFVHGNDGTLLATAPVWSIPGISESQVPATCASTAFDQVLECSRFY